MPTGPRFTPAPLLAENLAGYVARHGGTVSWRYRAAVTVFAPAAEVSARWPIQMIPVEPIDDESCSVHLGADNVETPSGDGHWSDRDAGLR